MIRKKVEKIDNKLDIVVYLYVIIVVFEIKIEEESLDFLIII